MSEINNLVGQILTMRGALKRIDGMCSEAGRYNEIVADRVIDRVQEIAGKALGSDRLNGAEIEEAKAALTAKDAEIERLRSALEAIATADQPRWNALRLQMVACEALETHERADVPRQDRRYRALRHQTPASPTGDTR